MCTRFCVDICSPFSWTYRTNSTAMFHHVTPRLFSRVAASFYILTSYQVPISPLPSQCLLLPFLIVAIRENYVVFLSDFDLHSIMNNDIEHLFMYLFANYLSCSKNYLIKSFTHFKMFTYLFIIEL